MREPLYCKTKRSDEVTIPTTEWGNCKFTAYGVVQLYRLETFNERQDSTGALWLLLTRVSLQLDRESEKNQENIQIIGDRFMTGYEAIEVAVGCANLYFVNQFQIDFQNMLAEWMISNNQVADLRTTPTPPELLENDGDA